MATHANSTRVSAREVMKRAWRTREDIERMPTSDLLRLLELLLGILSLAELERLRQFVFSLRGGRA